MKLNLYSGFVMPIICLLLVIVVGFLDYFSGVENSMLLLYLVPIAIAAWYGNIWLAMATSIGSVAGWIISDLAAGIARINVWNVLTAFVAYAIIGFLLTRWHELLKQMHLRVEQRTAALQRELTARKRLEAELAAIAERERERLGRELHDSLGQHLTGTSLLAQTLAVQMEASDKVVAQKANEVVVLIDQGIELTREIARGLLSFELEADGLVAALNTLATSTAYERRVDCRFEPSGELCLSKFAANHVYWIAREAVTNAVKHGNPRRILIRLRSAGGPVQLRVEDDGRGLNKRDRNELKGIGLKVMARRAQLVGGNLQIDNAPSGGVIVSYEIPAHA